MNAVCSRFLFPLDPQARFIAPIRFSISFWAAVPEDSNHECVFKAVSEQFPFICNKGVTRIILFLNRIQERSADEWLSTPATGVCDEAGHSVFRTIANFGISMKECES